MQGPLRIETIGKTALVLLLFVLLPATVAEGGGGGGGSRPGKEPDQRKRIELSLRIAEAKGKNAVRTYFRSLKRQNREKPLRAGLPTRH